MACSPERRAAEEALTAAIEALLAVVDGEDAGRWVLTEYVVLTAQQGWDEEGSPETSLGLFTRDNLVPLHRSLGLIEHARARLTTGITEPDQPE